MGNQIHLYKGELYIIGRVSDGSTSKNELILKADLKHQLISSCYQLEDVTNNPVDIHIETVSFTVEDPASTMVQVLDAILASGSSTTADTAYVKSHEADTVSGCTIEAGIQGDEFINQTTTVLSHNPTTYELPAIQDCLGNDLTYDFSGLANYITTSGSTLTFAPYDNAIAGEHIVSFAATSADPP